MTISRFLGAILSCFLAISGYSFASQPCKINPCSTGTCYEKASWVVDGTLTFIGKQNAGHTSSIKISDIAVIKGTQPAADPNELFYGGPYCYSPRFPQKLIGTRLRFYGIGNRTIIDYEETSIALIRESISERKERLYASLENLSPATCISEADDKNSGETFFNRGKAFFELGRHTEARSCFFRALAYREENSSYRGACFYIGLMYETGSGFEKDIEIAKSWIKHAGY